MQGERDTRTAYASQMLCAPTCTRTCVTLTPGQPSTLRPRARSMGSIASAQLMAHACISRSKHLTMYTIYALFLLDHAISMLASVLQHPYPSPSPPTTLYKIFSNLPFHPPFPFSAFPSSSPLPLPAPTLTPSSTIPLAS